MMEQGRGERFRQPSLFERVAAGMGAFLPRALHDQAAHAYARLLGHVHPRGVVANLPGGEQVRLLASHRYLAWNPEEYDAFRADIRAGDTILDLGANIGGYTVLFARWAGPRGRVFAFEPAAETFQALGEMLRLNGVADLVTANRLALSAAEGRAFFQANGSDGANRLLPAAAADAVAVDTTTVDAFCERMELVPDMIKIDVEGAELDVLRGARRTIARSPGVRIYVEMHPHLWPDFNVTQADIVGELAAQQLRAERLDGRPDIWNIEGVCLRLVRCAS